MKRIGLVLIACCLSLSCFAKEKAPMKASIKSVRKCSGENKSGTEVEMLKINTSQSDMKLPAVMYVAVALEDKNDVTYYGEVKKPAPSYRLNGNGDEPDGTVEWMVEIDASNMKRPKIVGYTVEYRYEKGDESILLDSDYSKVDSPEELRQAFKKTSTKVKLKTKGKPVFPSSGGGE